MSTQDLIAVLSAVLVFIVGILTWLGQKRSNKNADIVTQLAERNDMITEVQQERDHMSSEITQCRLERAEASAREQGAYRELQEARNETLKARSDLVDAHRQLHDALVRIDVQTGQIQSLEEAAAIKRAQP